MSSSKHSLQHGRRHTADGYENDAQFTNSLGYLQNGTHIAAER